jgi:hypothetical protein
MRDHVDDANPLYLYKAAETITLPDFVLQAPMLSGADVSDLHERAFADSAGRMFPLHTKEATVMSAMAYFGQGGKDAHVQARIRAAAGQHGVLDLEQEIERCFEPVVKAASAPSDPRYALRLNREDGPPQYFYPIDSETELTQSARFLTKDASENRLPLSFVRAAAQEIVKRANELGLSIEHTIPVAVRNLGEDRIPDFEVAKAAAFRRLEFGGVPQEGYQILIDTVDAAKEAHANGEDLEDFITVWRMVDDGAQVKYSALIKDPYQSFYAGVTRDEVIKFARSIVFVGETPIPCEVIGALTDADIDGHFRADTSATVKQARDAAVRDSPTATQSLANLGEVDERALLTLLLATSAG